MRNRVSNPAITLGSTDEVEDEDSEYSENADAKERILVTVDWKVRKLIRIASLCLHDYVCSILFISVRDHYVYFV